MLKLKSFNSFLQDMFDQNPVLPVVAGIQTAEDAVSYASALKKGGIDNIEMTLRTDGALEQIEAIIKSDASLIVGAGTVLTPEQVDQCAKAGASYIVSPGYGEDVERACEVNGLAYLPGAVTPTEVQKLYGLGYRYLKFFPASLNGGTDTMKAYGAVFKDIRFCCTGGVNISNASTYLALDNVVGVGMSALAPKAIIQARDWDGLISLTRSIAG